ncbi:IS110 family transposase [Streptomyces pseudogriseolus]|uniref:IS110 family transposase n=1 Tax=Streptomyces pseudogriseolus TaxID=36817 RepID=UPI003FA1F2BC
MPQARPGRDPWGGFVHHEGEIDVYLGLDVGKGEHHGTALTPAGKKVFDKPLPNSEPRLRELFEKLQAKHGKILVVVDQPASIGALPLAVARDAGCRVAYLPGLTMRRIADLYPGESKTDARDAAIIADAARTMPHTLRDLAPDAETVAELNMITGFDDDLAGEVTRTKNRLRGLLTQIHPSLERVLGPRLDHPAVRFLLERYGSPAQLRKAGRRRLITMLRPKAPRMADRLVEDIFDALDEQTVVVPGTDAAALIVPSLAASLTAVLDQRRLLAARIEELLEAHPLSQVLTSMPGIGVRTAARILVDVGDGSGFATAGHLAAYAGLAPATRRSGSSIRGEHPARRGNKQLKRAFYLAAFASLSQPDSRAYYDRKRREGKHHVAALVCLARRRIDVLFAMLRDGTFYQPPKIATA